MSCLEHLANHFLPTNGTDSSGLQAWGVFRHIDSLADYTFTGNAAAKDIALGNGSPAETYMGQWNDGTPVKLLGATDLPDPAEYFAGPYVVHWADTANPRRNVLLVPDPATAGDYNRDGAVDAADYVFWRKTLNPSSTGLADGNHNNQVDAGDYDIWRAHFGQPPGSGSGATTNAAVPEPTTLMLLVFAVTCCRLRRTVNMVTASAASDFDQDWVNIANRFNGGNAFTGNVSLDWWFYDPTGPGNSNYRDYVALGNYSVAATAASSGQDYTTASGGNLNTGSVFQRLSLGASNPTGFDNTKYQARVVGAADGTASGNWFNVGTRSVGWHEGKITLGDPNGASTPVSFYIDGVDVLDHAIMTSNGVNVIEANAGFGSTVANYDDFSLSTVPEPATIALAGAGLLVVSLLVRRRSGSRS